MNLEKNKEDMLSSFNHSIEVQLGTFCCKIVCNDKEVLDSLAKLYGDFPSTQKPDITLELEIVKKMDSVEFEAALPEVKFFHEGDYFKTSYSMVVGKRNLDTGNVAMEVEKHIFRRNSGRSYVNHAICSLYYTACKLVHNGNPPAFMVHSSGIIRHDQVLLFVGPSEIGKSTIARLCGEENGQVINDEAVLIHRPLQGNNTLMVQGIPIIGDLPHRLNVTAPLRAVLLLAQGKRTSVRRLDRMEAYVRFMRQIVCPAFIGQMDRRAIYSMIVDFSNEATQTVPFYELEFTLDRASLWEVIEELETSLDREGR
jgi:hypothetical protein